MRLPAGRTDAEHRAYWTEWTTRLSSLASYEGGVKNPPDPARAQELMDACYLAIELSYPNAIRTPTAEARKARHRIRDGIAAARLDRIERETEALLDEYGGREADLGRPREGGA